MPTIEETVHIRATPAAIHEVLMDLDAAPFWTTGLERFELVEGTAGRPGCRGRAHYLEGSRRYELDDLLVECVPGRRYVSKVRGGGIRATVATTLSEIPSGTRVAIRWEGQGANPITSLLLSFLRGRLSRRMRDDMVALRDLVESRSG